MKVLGGVAGASINHIICGDFNPTGWEAEYARWTHTAGMWELSNPAAPTFTSGRALDRFLILPGSEMFEALLPPSVEHEEVQPDYPKEGGE